MLAMHKIYRCHSSIQGASRASQVEGVRASGWGLGTRGRQRVVEPRRGEDEQGSELERGREGRGE